MPRQPKPFYRKQTQSWHLQIGKRQIPLGRDQEEAFRLYHQIMAGRVKVGPGHAEYLQASGTGGCASTVLVGGRP